MAQNGFSLAIPNKDADLYEKCQALSKEKKEKKKIFAVIGPGGSTVSINVQNLLQLFDIPQIGYSATSRDLSDKKTYKTFLRVVPSDYLQVRAMLDLVVRMKWTYLFAIYTDGSYGQAGMEAFRNETSYLEICLAMYEKIREYASDDDYDGIIKRMNRTHSAKVIVCFCYGETIRGLLGAINRLGLKGRFLIVGSDGWSDRIDVAKDYYEEAVGSFSIKAYSPKVTEFDNYFINLNPTNNDRNIWFTEYWEDRFNCYIDETSKAKFKTSCKRKCPANFVQIGQNCYYFSTQKANWAKARAECKLKYAQADLLDLNAAEDVADVLDYAASQSMNEHVQRMHARIKFGSMTFDTTAPPVAAAAASAGDTDTAAFLSSAAASSKSASHEEQTLKLMHCRNKKNPNRRHPSNKPSRFDVEDDAADLDDGDEADDGDYDDEEDNRLPYMIGNNNNMSSLFLSTLSDDDVITFFNSRFNRPDSPQCIAIRISSTSGSSSHHRRRNFNYNHHRRRNNNNNFTYCIQFNVCQRRLPFVCKLPHTQTTTTTTTPSSRLVDKKTNRTQQQQQQHRAEFYPDTLRNYQQDPKMSYVINALLAIAHGLDRIHLKFCQGVPGLCEKMKNLNGSELLNNIKASKFSGITGEDIYFDANGDPPGRYVILNVQKEENSVDNETKYVYREVGHWNNADRLSLNVDIIKFPNDKKQFRSVCSEACNFGYVKQIQGGVKCCWTCKKCEDHAYIANEYTCKDCEFGFWPNKNLTGCEKLPLTYLKWNELAALVALFVSCLGILVNTFITYVFVTFSNTCIVKSTTKELSYIILTGVYMCYMMTWPLIMRPSEITCYMYRVLPGFSLSLIYGALITKTNRIARILARSKKRIITKKLRFMSLTSQIIITLSIITIEIMLIGGSFVLEPGDVVIVDDRTRRNESRLMCAHKTWSVLGPIGYNMCLVVLCTVYAVRTRNLPENFNEAKFIGFSMYTTCVIWLAFIPLFFGSDFKVITLCLSTSFSATVVLIFLFVPKVYIILFEPEKNQRSAFATAKEIRCHFGSNVQSSDERSKMGNGFALLDKLGLKPAEVKSSLKTNGSSSQRSRSAAHSGGANTRFAYRPRSMHGDPRVIDRSGLADKSVDSFDTYTSIYQIADRSAQTSLELLEPFVDRAIKRRKLIAQDTRASLDGGGEDAAMGGGLDGQDVAIDRKSSKMAEMLELEKNETGAPTGLGALGNLLLLPLIATHTNQMAAAMATPIPMTQMGESTDSRKKRADSSDDDGSLHKHRSTMMSSMLTDENNNEVSTTRALPARPRLGKRLSQGTLLIEPFNKVFNKARNLRMSMRLVRRMSQLEHEIAETQAQEEAEAAAAVVASVATKTVGTTTTHSEDEDNNDDKREADLFGRGTSPTASTPTPPLLTAPPATTDSNTSLESTAAVALPSSSSRLQHSHRTPLKFTKSKNVLNQIVENSISVDSSEYSNSRKVSTVSAAAAAAAAAAVAGVVHVEEMCEEDTDSSSSVPKPASTATKKTPQQQPYLLSKPTASSQVTSDCESEFTIKMELEDKSLEDFNRVINQNKNLVLNWDYVQSSDYL